MATYTNEDYLKTLVPEDVFVPAKLLKVEEKTIKWKDKNTGEPKEAVILEWTWGVQGGDHHGKTVKGSCDPRLSTHESNRFRQWVEGTLGRELAVDEDIDTDDLIGLTAEISVKHEERKGTVYANLEDVVPADVDDTPF